MTRKQRRINVALTMFTVTNIIDDLTRWCFYFPCLIFFSLLVVSIDTIDYRIFMKLLSITCILSFVWEKILLLMKKKIINLQLCKKKKKHQNLYVKKSMIFPADYLQPQLNNGGPLCDDTTAFGRWTEEPGAPQQRPSDCTKSQSIPRGQNISWRSNGRWIWRENRPCYKPKQVENSLFVYTDTYSLWQL